MGIDRDERTSMWKAVAINYNSSFQQRIVPNQNEILTPLRVSREQRLRHW